MGHPNKAAAMRGYDAFAAGDMATLNEVIADDVVWHAPGDNIITGVYKGKEEVFGLFGKIGQETQGSFANEIHDMLANDDHVVALISSTGERNGKKLHAHAVHVMHMRDGQLTEFWNFADDQKAVDDFWS